MPHFTRRPSLAIALLLGGVLLAAGCRGPREVATGTLPGSYPNDSVAQIRQALMQGTDTLRAFRADARVSVDTPARSGRFSSSVYARRGAEGDFLLMTLSKFGIEGGRILVTPDSFFVYDAVRSELTYGALADAGPALPAPLRSGRAFENLLGIVAPGADLGWQVRPSTAAEGENRYVLTSSSERGARRLERRLTVDPSRWRALRYTERIGDSGGSDDSGGALLEERRFSEFGRFEGVFLPRRVELRRPQDQSSASVYYQDLTLNPSDLPAFEIDVPEGTERIRARAR